MLSGEGGRLISINAEYDALPEVGHACGHHLIAGSSIAAFLGMHFALKKRGIKGRVQLLGTPAEESGGGKVSLLNAGAYKGVDAALMSFVSPFQPVTTPSNHFSQTPGAASHARPQPIRNRPRRHQLPRD